MISDRLTDVIDFRTVLLDVWREACRHIEISVSIETIAGTLRTFVGGQIVSDYRDNDMGELYDVWLRAAGGSRSMSTPSRLP